MGKGRGDCSCSLTALRSGILQPGLGCVGETTSPGQGQMWMLTARVFWLALSTSPQPWEGDTQAQGLRVPRRHHQATAGAVTFPLAHMFAFSSPYPREWPWEVAFDANRGQVVATPPMTEASLLVPPLPRKVGLSLTSPLPCRLPPADHSRKEQPSSMRIRAPGCSRGDLEGCGLGSDRRAQGL